MSEEKKNLTLTMAQRAKLKAMMMKVEEFAASLQLMFLKDMQEALGEETFDFIVRVHEGVPIKDTRLKTFAKLAVDMFAMFTKLDEAVNNSDLLDIEGATLAGDKVKEDVKEFVEEPAFVPERPETAAEEIAQACLEITLESRGRDSLDFHEFGVGRLEKLLVTAFNRGQRQGIKLGEQDER